MSQTFGIESPGGHVARPERAPVRFVVVIDSGETPIARLFLASFEQVAEFDAGAPEVVQMIAGVRAAKTAASAEWDRALKGHSQAERLTADVYELTV